MNHEGARTPADDCPPYDPTLWAGKDCFFLTKLLASQEVRDELAERGLEGDLNAVVNAPRYLVGRKSRRSASGSFPGASTGAFLAPEPQTAIQRVKTLAHAVMNLVGLSASDEAGASPPVLHQATDFIDNGWLSRWGIRRILSGLGAVSPQEVITTVPQPIAVTPTDNLHDRLDIALSVGDTVTAASIAAELARRRATIQRMGVSSSNQSNNQHSSAQRQQSGATANFWS